MDIYGIVSIIPLFTKEHGRTFIQDWTDMRTIVPALATLLVDIAQNNPENQFWPVSLKYLTNIRSLPISLPLDSVFHKDCHIAADLASRLALQFGMNRVVWFDEMERKFKDFDSRGREKTITIPAETFYVIQT